MLSLVWSFWAYTTSKATYQKARGAFDSGQYLTVEGPVEQFVPSPPTGHAIESFSVKGVPFTMSDYVTSPGYNQTSANGGAIKEGSQVRIGYFDNVILKLEVAAP